MSKYYLPKAFVEDCVAATVMRRSREEAERERVLRRYRIGKLVIREWDGSNPCVPPDAWMELVSRLSGHRNT